MSLLLLLSEASAPANPVITVPAFGLQFKIEDAPAGVFPMRLGFPRDRRRRLSIVRNEFVRFVQGFELTYTMFNRALLRCETLDVTGDPTNDYRPSVDQEFILALTDGTILFRGRIEVADELPVEDPNVGTVVKLSVIDYSEFAEHTFVEQTFGTDPRPIAAVAVGNPAHIHTVEPHGFTSGDTVVLDGVVDSVPNVNGAHVATVISATELTIPVNVTTAGAGGTVRSLKYLREILQTLVPSVFTPNGVELDSTMNLGPLLEKQVFDGTLQEAIEQLRKASGWAYRWLPTKVFQMFAPGTKDAPFVLSGTAGNVVAGTRKNTTRAPFANAVRLSYGSNAVVDKDDPFVGDGTTRVFPLSYKPASGSSTQSPGMVFDIAAQAWRHVGVWGYDTLFEWTYRASDNTLVQLQTWGGAVNWPAPADGFRFFFRYGVQFPQVIEAVDQPSIDLRGKRTKRIKNEKIFDRYAALQYAQSQLSTAVENPRKITVATHAGMVFPGTTVEVDLPDRLISGAEWLVVAVRVREREDGNLHFTYELLEDNQFRPGWIDFFKELRDGAGSGGSSSGSTSSSIPPPATGTFTNIGFGTPGYVPAWISASTLGDSMISQAAGKIRAHAPITSAAGDLTIEAVENIVLNPTSTYVIPQNPLQTNLGRYEKKFLTLHAAELWVETLVAQDTIATIGGRVLIGPTTQLVADLAIGANAIRVKHNNLSIGHVVYMEAGGKIEYMTVTSAAVGAAGDWTYQVTRNLDGSGANAWIAGDAVFNTGTVGSGWIDLYSMRGVKSAAERGPTIAGNVRTGAGASDHAPRWGIGNLAGLYGFSADTFGVALGRYPQSFMTITDAGGIRMNSNGVDYVTILPTGSASFAGTISATAGLIGGWTIQSPYLFAGSLSAQRVVLSADGADFLWAGHFNVGSAPFRVTAAGVLHATGAIISGAITVTGGNAAKTDMSNVTTIDGGKITTGSLHADRIIGGTITADKMNVSALSAISANLGTVTAGSVVVQSGGNKMWVNEGGDNVFAVGGTTKISAPLFIDDDGELDVDRLYVNVDMHISHLSGGGDRFLKVNNAGQVFAA